VSDYSTRPVTRDDAPALTALLAAAEAVDRTDEHYNLDDVLEELGNPMIDISTDWLVVEHEGEVVAHSQLRPRAPADGAVSVGIDGTVRPDHRRRGVGSMLVPRMVERALEFARERGEGLRPIVTGHAPSTNQDLATIFERLGLRPERWSFMMLADLEEAAGPSPELPEGYTLHTWEGVEDDEVREAHNRAFVGHYGFTPWDAQMWSQWVSESRAYRPALSFVARDATGAIAAYVQTCEYDAVAEATGLKEAYVAKVGTLEDHRRRGLAGLLLRIALQRYREEGYDRAALDVDSENETGALGVYERAGFRTDLRWTSYRLMESSG
jgi:mycothiol synthase